MQASEVKQLLESQLDSCEAIVEAEGNHYSLTVISDVFKGLMPVKKQQLVYAVLNEAISSGAIHAVNMKTFTREQWEKQV
jgi:acid stress-induced BolA-like protein IbaG/YrbA